MKLADWLLALFIVAAFALQTCMLTHIAKDNLKLMTENLVLLETLNNPHHCVSVCADEFKKWGC